MFRISLEFSLAYLEVVVTSNPNLLFHESHPRPHLLRGEKKAGSAADLEEAVAKGEVRKIKNEDNVMMYCFPTMNFAHDQAVREGGTVSKRAKMDDAQYESIRDTMREIDIGSTASSSHKSIVIQIDSLIFLYHCLVRFLASPTLQMFQSMLVNVLLVKASSRIMPAPCRPLARRSLSEPRHP